MNVRTTWRTIPTAVMSVIALGLMTSLALGQATDPIVYDNGVTTITTGLSSQNDTVYPFESGVADDFMLPDSNGSGMNYDINGISFTGLQFGTPPDLPNPLTFNIYFFEDDGSGTAPAYTGDGTSSPAPDAIGSVVGAIVTAPEPAPGPYTYSFDFGSTINLDVDTQYWVCVQSENVFPPQFGWQADNSGGGNALQGFPFLGTPFWTTVDPGTEMDFRLHGAQNLAGAVTVVPKTLEVMPGLIAGGGLPELAESDNEDLRLFRDPVAINAVTQFVITATSPTFAPTTFDFTLEGSCVSRPNVVQRVELFDYVAGAFEVVDEQDANRVPSPDLTVVISPPGDLARFVDQATGEIQARVRYRADIARAQFASNTDQAVWTIE